MCACCFLIETYDLICYTVEENRNGSAEFSPHANNCEGGAVAVMSSPFEVVLFAVVPHFFKLGIRLVGLVQTGEHNGNAKEHKQLVLKILFEHWLGDVVEVASDKALFADKELMRVSLNDSRLLHRLVGATDPITVEVMREIVHFLNTWQRFANHKVILIEHLARQRLVPLLDKRGAEGA